MNNFRFHACTDVRFGRGQVAALPEVMAPYGKKVLLVYGGGSIKKNGLYDQVKSLLSDYEIWELSGVKPNPDVASVREGAKLCKEHGITVVLGVGGGSTIDASKVIAAAANYDQDAWDLVIDPSKIGKVLPVVCVLTLAATGTEMNINAVISNPETNDKFGTNSHEFIPKAAICDPTYLFTLPPIQTAAGTADIMSHVFEQYFQKYEGAYLTDQISEGVLRTCIKYCPIALQEPDNYEARSNLMWASTVGLNSLCSLGKGGAWTAHPIEHELSAFYDITHGTGLAIVTPAWMRYILSDATVGKFAVYAKNVWGIEDNDPYVAANKAIDATRDFFVNCGIPKRLSDVGIDESKLAIMASKAVKSGGLQYAYVSLNEEDVLNILKACL
ncbi:MAG: iron-containing alcohol dehydrogenase [Clostridium sp.]|jgi:alcohol dehydrogenase YqhD (iron-dependent ADH family)|nr:iron-containing alcohol dehydrogenase [Clostridium sp.]